MDGHGAFDDRVRIVADDLEVPDLVAENGLRLPSDLQLRVGTGLAGELLLHLVEVVGIHECVTEGVDELPHLEPCLLGNHVGQQGIRGDVEGDAQEEVAGALVELTVQLPGLAVTVRGDVELEHRVA